jgi:serine/threonine protein kinase
VLRDFATGRLDQSAAPAVQAHLVSCPLCSAAVASLRQSAGHPSNSAVVLESASDSQPDTSGRARSTPAGAPTILEKTIDRAVEPDDLEEDLIIVQRSLQPAANRESLGRLGDYEVLGFLGRGGMGVVLKGFDTLLNRPVAIKVLTPQLSASEKARRRFLREARAAAAVNHPNVVTIHAVAEHVGLPYLVMEHIHGGTLRQRTQREPPLDLGGVLRISCQVAQGLAAAHAQGLIHRDIKPSNIMLEDATERVKITDFGLARAGQDLSEITSLGHRVGTPAYMAPEQMGGSTVDARSDLFAVGCVMYAMFDGHSPFHSSNNLEVMRKVAEYDPPPLHEKHADVPRVISDLVSRLLQKDPAGRFQSAAKLAEILTQHVATINQTQSGKVPQFDVGIGHRTPSPGTWYSNRWTVLACSIAGLVACLAVFQGREAWFGSASDGASPGPIASDPSSVEEAGKRAAAPVAPMCKGEVDTIQAAAIWPAGPRVLFAGEPQTHAVLWDWQREQVVTRLVGHESWVRAVAFDESGQRALTAGGGSWKLIDGKRPGGEDYSIRLWDVESGLELKRLKGHAAAVRCLVFLRDGVRVASGGDDYRLRVWSLESGDELQVIDSPSREILSLAVSPTDDHIVAGSFRRAGIWDLATSTEVHALESLGHPVFAVAYSPDGQFVATGAKDGTVALWSVSDGRRLRAASKHDDAVRGVAFSPDGKRLLTGGDDRTVRLCEVETGRELIRLQTDGTVNVVGFCRDGRVFAGGNDGCARLLELAEPSATQ